MELFAIWKRLGPFLDKTIFIVMCAGVFMVPAGTSRAQSTPEAFLSLVPAIPQYCCNRTRAEKEAYIEKLEDLRARIDEELALRKAETEANVQREQGDIKKHFFNKMGVSEEEIESLENAGEAEQMAMAEKILQKQYNVSLGELQNLSNMSEEGQKAWAEAYGTEMMAFAQADTHNEQSQGDMDSASRRDRELQTLMGRVQGRLRKPAEEFSKLQDDPEEKKIRENEIMPLELKVMSMMGAVSKKEEAEFDRLSEELKKRKLSYCEKFSSRYRAALEDHLRGLKANLPDYSRIERLQAETFKEQTGVDRDVLRDGVIGLEGIRDYILLLQDAFNYDLRTEREME